MIGMTFQVAEQIHATLDDPQRRVGSVEPVPWQEPDAQLRHGVAVFVGAGAAAVPQRRRRAGGRVLGALVPV